MGKVFSKCPRKVSHCQQEQGAFPGKAHGQGRWLLTSAIAAPVFPLDGSRQIAMNRLSLPLLLHTHTRSATELCTHTSVCLTAQEPTGQRGIISETARIKVHPSFRTDTAVPGKLQLGCSTKVQALPTVVSGEEWQHCSELSQCRSFSHRAPLLWFKLLMSSAWFPLPLEGSFAPSRSFKKIIISFYTENWATYGCSYHKIIMLRGLEILGCALYMAIIPGIWLSRDYPTPGMPHCLIRTNGMITIIIYKRSPLPKSK